MSSYEKFSFFALLLNVSDSIQFKKLDSFLGEHLLNLARCDGFLAVISRSVEERRYGKMIRDLRRI